MSEWKDISSAPIGILCLFFWRPVDYEERPFHTEMVVGQLSQYHKNKAWIGGRLYDVKTHLTHWMDLPNPPLPDPPKESK